MKIKAQNNLESAQILIEKKQYTCSVHCSYYAVFQYMKYMLANTNNNPISFTEQNSHNGEDSHEYILNETKNRINQSYKIIRNFSEEVRILKKNRVEADYQQKEFTDLESLDCKKNAEGLISTLKRYFGNI